MGHKIIAVVGMCGSGKSIVTDKLVENGWRRIYFGGVTLDELNRRGMPDTPENERLIREEMRQKYGMAAYAVIRLPEILAAYEQGDVVLDGLYSWSEYLYLREKLPVMPKLLAIVPDKELRYKRLSERAKRPLTPEEAQARDFAEIGNLEKGGPIAMADRFINNNGTRDDLYAAAAKIIAEM